MLQAAEKLGAVSRCVPGRTGGQLRSFEQYAVCPAGQRQVIDHRTADSAPPPMTHDPGMIRQFSHRHVPSAGTRCARPTIMVMSGPVGDPEMTVVRRRRASSPMARNARFRMCGPQPVPSARRQPRGIHGARFQIGNPDSPGGDRPRNGCGFRATERTQSACTARSRSSRSIQPKNPSAAVRPVPVPATLSEHPGHRAPACRVRHSCPERGTR